MFFFKAFFRKSYIKYKNAYMVQKYLDISCIKMDETYYLPRWQSCIAGTYGQDNWYIVLLFFFFNLNYLMLIV